LTKKVIRIRFVCMNCIYSDLINDWASSNPPDIYSFAPYIYDINIKGTYLELLVPCTQGNWIDCCDSSENSKITFFFRLIF